jgi:hypothetical protein
MPPAPAPVVTKSPASTFIQVAGGHVSAPLYPASLSSRSLANHVNQPRNDESGSLEAIALTAFFIVGAGSHAPNPTTKTPRLQPAVKRILPVTTAGLPIVLGNSNIERWEVSG